MHTENGIVYPLGLAKGKRWILVEGVQIVINLCKLQTVHTFKWISFACISNFATVKEILLSCHQLFEIFISSCQEFELHSALSLDTPVEIRFFLAAITSPFCPSRLPVSQPASLLHCVLKCLLRKHFWGIIMEQEIWHSKSSISDFSRFY